MFQCPSPASIALKHLTPLGRHDIPEILLKVALNTKISKSINQSFS
jgi:hypothetical protein